MTVIGGKTKEEILYELTIHALPTVQQSCSFSQRAKSSVIMAKELYNAMVDGGIIVSDKVQ